MSYGSNEAVLEQEKNQKWYTKKCSYCGDNCPVRAEDYEEPCYCDDCGRKLFTSKD